MSSAGAAKRVAESDGSTLGVHFLGVNTELLDTVGGLTRESFVQFDDIDVSQFESCLLENFRDGNSRADTHDLWGNSGHSVAYNLSNDWQPQLLRH